MSEREFAEIAGWNDVARKVLSDVTFPLGCFKNGKCMMGPKKVEVRMYNVQKKDGKTIIYDWQNSIIWSASDGDFILYSGPNGPTADKVGNLSDAQILTALASSIKLSL